MGMLRAFWNRHELFGLLMVAVLVFGLWFVASYGERLNPFDGIAWSDSQR